MMPLICMVERFDSLPRLRTLIVLCTIAFICTVASVRTGASVCTAATAATTAIAICVALILAFYSPNRQRHDALEQSPFGLLSTPSVLRHVVDALDQDDAFAFALCCTAFRAVTCQKPCHGHLTMARFPQGTRSRPRAMWSSVARLEWARGLGCPWTVMDMGSAAKKGQLEVMQWARANGCEWSSATCSQAAFGGNLAVLQWARANGCQWDASTCSDAAEGGHLAILKWARANDCEWDTNATHRAREREHTEVLEWLLANGCPDEPGSSDDDEDFAEARNCCR
jgi:hypothetical protein